MAVKLTQDRERVKRSLYLQIYSCIQRLKRTKKPGLPTLFRKQTENSSRAFRTCLIKAQQHPGERSVSTKLLVVFSLGSSVRYSGQPVRSGSHYITGPAACKSSQWNATPVDLWDGNLWDKVCRVSWAAAAAALLHLNIDSQPAMITSNSGRERKS